MSYSHFINRWQSKPFSIGEDVALAQFHLANASFGEMIGISGRRDRNGFRKDSSVYLNFIFERQTGFFLLQIYTPLTLIVFCSWVSFWLVKTDKEIMKMKRHSNVMSSFSGR